MTEVFFDKDRIAHEITDADTGRVVPVFLKVRCGIVVQPQFGPRNVGVVGEEGAQITCVRCLSVNGGIVPEEVEADA